MAAKEEQELLARITSNPGIFGGKPIIGGRRLAVEHVLGMLTAGSTASEIIEHYPFLENQDIQACLIYSRRVVAPQKVEPALEPEPGHE